MLADQRCSRVAVRMSIVACSATASGDDRSGVAELWRSMAVARQQMRAKVLAAKNIGTESLSRSLRTRPCSACVTEPFIFLVAADQEGELFVAFEPTVGCVLAEEVRLGHDAPSVLLLDGDGVKVGVQVSGDKLLVYCEGPVGDDTAQVSDVSSERLSVVSLSVRALAVVVTEILVYRLVHRNSWSEEQVVEG